MNKILKRLVVFTAVFSLCFLSAQSIGKSEAAVKKVTIGGNSIGIRLYLDGLLVVGESDILSGGKKICPGKIAGIEKGDRIVKLNGENIENVEVFCRKVEESGGKEIKLEIARGDKFYEKVVKPVFYDDAGKYKIGLWVRDSAAGIGTITYVTENGSFAALGHGISDIDTRELICLKDGDVLGSRINSVLKGAAGSPGDLRGTFDMSFSGQVLQNTPKGIFGTLLKSPLSGEEAEVALAKEVKAGKAVIYTNVEGQKVEQFDIEIERVYPFIISGEKNMVIKITDPRLIEKTGGIVQGMSGSPIVQNGKLVGAVTHVFVNDPTRGYGIFIENMLAEAEKIK